MAAQSKIELILELQNKIGSGLQRARTQITREVSGMQKSLSNLTKDAGKNFKELANEIPGAGKALRLLSNPLTMAAAGVTAIGAGLVKATQRAAEFNTQFRDLANLNLDKSMDEINRLQKYALNTAYKGGFNAEKTSAGFFDVQSTTGLYGSEVRKTVEQQGEFANLMRADFNEYIQGSAKAMANWRFNTDELEDFNRSNYAAMKVGVTTFDQLAKVQSVYAGAAASVNQSYDTANKMFALFSVRTKSVDEAATLTKSLFNDLTKATTVKAFKSIGIDLFDANKQLKQTDKIMLELNKKFRSMKNDKSIVALKNQFTGSEGLIAMIQAATDKTTGLSDTMAAFENARMETDKARAIAENDIIYRQEKLTQRIDNLMIKLGQVVLPWKEKLVGVGENIVSIVNSQFRWRANNEETQTERYSEGSAKALSQFANENLAAMNDTEFEAFRQRVGDAYGQWYNKMRQENERFANISANSWGLFMSDENKAAKIRQQMNYSTDFASGGAEALRDYMQNLPQLRAQQMSAGTGTGTDPAAATLEDSLTRVVGAAKAPKNITINIDSFVKGGINTEETTMQHMDASQIEQFFTDLCFRVIRNVETSYY